MGYMTVVSILNDGWDTIKQNPKTFMENIEKGMHGYGHAAVQSFPVGNYANPMEVHRSRHANMSQLLLVGGNKMEDLNDFEPHRMSDFYLAYKLRAIHEAEEKLEDAKEFLIRYVADELAKQARLLPEYKAGNLATIHLQQIAENMEVFAFMSNDEKRCVYQKTQEYLQFK